MHQALHVSNVAREYARHVNSYIVLYKSVKLIVNHADSKILESDKALLGSPIIDYVVN